MTAVGVDGRYIADLARARLSPAFDPLAGRVQGARTSRPNGSAASPRIGYANLPADDLVQLKALDVTPDYIAGFERLGYRHLPVDKLVQLKALDITPEFVALGDRRQRAAAAGRRARRMKMFGRRR